MAKLKENLPVVSFMQGSNTFGQNFDLKTMTNCTGARKLVKDMYGHYCFNFVGTLGGYKLKNFDSYWVGSFQSKDSSGPLESEMDTSQFEFGAGLAGYSGLFVFGRVLCLTGIILLMKIMGMGRLADNNEETGQGVVMQAPNHQKADIE